MEHPKVTSDELDLDDDGLRACYKEQGLFDNVGVDVRLKILPEVEDEDGNMVPYARLSIDLTVDLTEGPDHWSIGWTNYLYYLQGDLKPYLDRFCPYPEEVWLEIWSHLRSVVRQADFDQPQGTSRAAA